MVAPQNVGIADGGPMFDIPPAELSEAHPLGIEAVDSLAQLVLVVDLVAVTGLSPNRGT